MVYCHKSIDVQYVIVFLKFDTTMIKSRSRNQGIASDIGPRCWVEIPMLLVDTEPTKTRCSRKKSIPDACGLRRFVEAMIYRRCL